MIVPALCVGMHPVTLRVTQGWTRSVRGGVPTQSVGTISAGYWFSAESVTSPSTNRRIFSGLAFCKASGNSASG